MNVFLQNLLSLQEKFPEIIIHVLVPESKARTPFL